jgi:hypothetical protein
MTRERARRFSWGLVFLSLAGLGLFAPGRAIAGPAGLALVIGVDRYASMPGGGACGPAARSVRDRLSEQGVTVQAVFDPSAAAMRTAIADFAAQLEEAPPGIALVYACGMAVTTPGHLFLLPSDAGSDGHLDPDRQGVVLPALLNALAGTGGAVYADRGLATPSATGDIGTNLPAGLHLALSLSGREGTAPIGQRLARSDFRVGQGWGAAAAMIQAGFTSPDANVRAVLLPPPGSPPSVSGNVMPDSAAPSANATIRASNEPAGNEPAGKIPPASVTAAPMMPSPNPVGQQPAAASDKTAPEMATPAQPSARGRSANAFERGGKRSKEPRRDRIRRLQTALARNGYRGPIDGRVHGRTMAAIRAFQRDLGDPGTGVLTRAELAQLLNH